VIRQGIPGTSMPAFDKLSEPERMQLAQEVERLYRSRIDDERIPEPGDPLAVPPLGTATAESISQGKTAYVRSGCFQCHGADGTGAGAPFMFDDAGRPASPRDLAHDPLKGGPSLESLYRRIRLGMPGTPHPAAGSLSEQELIDLVHYCRSLAKESPQQTTNYERSLRASGGR